MTNINTTEFIDLYIGKLTKLLIENLILKYALRIPAIKRVCK